MSVTNYWNQISFFSPSSAIVDCCVILFWKILFHFTWKACGRMSSSQWHFWKCQARTTNWQTRNINPSRRLETQIWRDCNVISTDIGGRWSCDSICLI